MIKINLALRKTSQLPTDTPKRQSLSIDTEQLKAIQLPKIILCAIVAFFAYDYLETYKTEQLAILDQEVAQLQVQMAKLQNQKSQYSGYEEQKAAIERDGGMIRTKMETIQKLLADRTTPPKLLMNLAQAIPKDVWLTELRLQDDVATLRGAAYGGVPPVTDFIRTLESSVYFREVRTLTGFASDRLGNGIERTRFDLEARRR
jgi:Tfp pilus assembly protein PilN